MGATRQRVGGRLLLLANLVAANAAAALAVIGFLRPGFVGFDLGPAGNTFGTRVLVAPLTTWQAWLLFLGGAVLLVGNFAWLVRRRERPQPADWVVSDTPSGPVRIAREALESGLRQAGEGLPEITRLRVEVNTRTQKRVLVTAWFQCAEGTSNLPASQRLRQAMIDRFGTMVRPADGTRVEFDLEFQGFAGKLGKKNVELPPPSDEQPFTGPRYPIDDETNLGGSR
jgi:membrane protein implicated in regulation of membrane protease activity